MASKSRRRPRRRPNVPPPGGRRSGSLRTASGADATSEDLSEIYSHVAKDLRRILVLAVIMFVIIGGAWYASDVLGSSFVLDAIR